nr:ADP-ribosylation factor-like protein [Candidatus Njordarchaeota archaeon]
MSSPSEQRTVARIMKVASRLGVLVDSLTDALRKIGAELRDIEANIDNIGMAGPEAGIVSGASGPEVIQVKSIGAADKSLEEIGDRVLTRQVEVIESPTGKRPPAGDEESKIIKMTLAGYGAVGKTTIFKLLKGVAAPAAYFPTIGANVDREDILIKNVRIRVWDLAGQEQYHRTWPIFLRNSKLVLLVTDSSKVNVERSKNLINLVKTIEPKAFIIGIANKQDLSDRLSPHEVESLLGVKSYGMVAIDVSYRDKIIEVIDKGIAEILKRES